MPVVNEAMGQDMMNTFLTTSRMKLERSLKSFEKEKRSRGGNGSGAVEVLGRLADGFLPDFLDFITTFRLHFCKVSTYSPVSSRASVFRSCCRSNSYH